MGGRALPLRHRHEALHVQQTPRSREAKVGHRTSKIRALSLLPLLAVPRFRFRFQIVFTYEHIAGIYQILYACIL